MIIYADNVQDLVEIVAELVLRGIPFEAQQTPNIVWEITIN